MFSPENIRRDFPILSRQINGKPLVYLDNAATSQKPRIVLKAMDDFQRQHNANVHRGIYTLSEEATELYETARQKVAKFINAKTSEEIIFTRNATESINLVALTWARQNLEKGEEILTTEMEHHSNIVPWQILAKEKGLKLNFLPTIPEKGILDLSKLANLLSSKTKLVCIGHISNLLGTINPIEKIIEQAHKIGAKVLVDGCQAVPHLPVDVQKINADFYAYSGHKMLGPTGIGVLWARKDLLETIEPIIGGGDMIKSVTKQKSIWNDLPWRFEAGTPNIVGVIGLGAAIDYLNQVGMRNVWEHEKKFVEYLLPKLKAIKGIKVFGIPEVSKNRGAIFSFWLEGMHPHDLASLFDEEGLCIRAGHMCAQVMLEAYGKPAAARVSFYLYNTLEEADKFLAAIERAKKVFNL
ncbi:MAG: cysteine desulfurase [Patescibacteria group bacterium]|jgi:cysteine desulfurase/selenocysteine lyase